MTGGVFVAQIGARRHYAVPSGLAAECCLAELHTTLCATHPLIRMTRFLPLQICPAPLRRLQQRIVPQVPSEQIHSWLMPDLCKALKSSLRSDADLYQSYVRRNRLFGKFVVRSGFGTADVVYAFNAAAVEIFEAASAKGLSCVLDQTMAPFAWVEQCLTDERLRWAGWDVRDVKPCHWQPLADREQREWELASVIVCGSEFVRQCVRDCGGPAEKCVIVPYDTGFQVRRKEQAVEGRPLRVLFAGTLCLRKGIQHLWDAVHRMESGLLDVRAVGPIQVSVSAVHELEKVITVEGPCPRAAMSDHYDWADVLVLPTLAEGSANVIYEALSAGVPVVTTSAAGSVVTEGHGGWIISSADAVALRDLLQQLCRQPALVDTARESIDRLLATVDLRPYGKRLCEVLCQHCHLKTTEA